MSQQNQNLPPQDEWPFYNEIGLLKASTSEEGIEIGTELWDGIYRAYSPQLVAYAGHICNGDTYAAEDVVQNAFEHALGCVNNFDYRQPHSLNAWLFAIVHNKAVDHLRKQRVASVYIAELNPSEVIPLWQSASGAQTPFEALSFGGTLHRIESALPAVQYRALLTSAMGYSVEENAALNNASRTNTGKRIHDARKAMKRLNLAA